MSGAPTPGLITRQEHYRRGSRAPRCWLYSVQTATGETVAVGTRLASAIAWAKERGLTPTKAWEQAS